MNKSFLLVLSIILSVIQDSLGDTSQSASDLWEAWKAKHNKYYPSMQERYRFIVFQENLNYVNSFNSQNNDTKLGLNKFADLTSSEFSKIYASGAFQSPAKEANIAYNSHKPKNLPDTFDWRSFGGVTQVKDQGKCGGCWAFSAVGSLEGFYFINNKTLLSFSEQQIIDCVSGTDQGCDGGFPSDGINYASKNGLELEIDYPFTAKDGNCNFNSAKAFSLNNILSYVTPNSSSHLKEAIVNGPVSVLVEADQKAFQLYSKGVIKSGCGAQTNHAVLAVGYQKVGLIEAFIVKNSWGADWGDQGYVYISTIENENKGKGVCGILSQPVMPSL